MKSTPNLLSTTSKMASSPLFSLKNGKVSKSVKTEVMRKTVLKNCHQKGRTGGLAATYCSFRCWKNWAIAFDWLIDWLMDGCQIHVAPASFLATHFFWSRRKFKLQQSSFVLAAPALIVERKQIFSFIENMVKRVQNLFFWIFRIYLKFIPEFIKWKLWTSIKIFFLDLQPT